MLSILFDWWTAKWIILAVVVAVAVSSRLSWWVVPYAVVCSVSGMLGFFATNDDTFRFYSYTGIAELLAVLVAAQLLSNARWFDAALAVAGIVNAALVYAFGVGLIYNGSFNGCLIAACAPFVLVHIRKPYALAACVFMFGAVIKLGGSMGYFCAVVALCAFVCSAWKMWPGILLALILGPVGAVIIPHYSDGTGRFEAWRRFYAFYSERLHPMIGSTYNSTPAITQVLQVNQPEGYFAFAHCDPLQTLVETGIPGVSALALMVVVTLYKLRKHPVYFASFASLCAAMIGNSVLHVAWLAVPFFYLIAKSRLTL